MHETVAKILMCNQSTESMVQFAMVYKVVLTLRMCMKPITFTNERFLAVFPCGVVSYALQCGSNCWVYG